MKWKLCVLALTFSLSACTQTTSLRNPKSETSLRLVTTTSVNDSGLMEYLRPFLLEETGLAIDIISVGSGAALEAGKRGDADVLLVHAPEDEKQFVQDGYGLKRSPLMHNYFVIVGPKDDPAQIRNLEAAAAFQSIWDHQQQFISRGDHSGTYIKEKYLWSLIGVDIQTQAQQNKTYISAGVGMGDVLMMASELQAYTLSDKATFLFLRNRLDLEVLVRESDALKNEYSIIVVNPAQVARTQVEAALRFESWMTQSSTQHRIAQYGIDQFQEALFYIYD